MFNFANRLQEVLSKFATFSKFLIFTTFVCVMWALLLSTGPTKFNSSYLTMTFARFVVFFKCQEPSVLAKLSLFDKIRR